MVIGLKKDVGLRSSIHMVMVFSERSKEVPEDARMYLYCGISLDVPKPILPELEHLTSHMG